MELPKLPEPEAGVWDHEKCSWTTFTADQMTEHAQAAVLADRAGRAEGDSPTVAPEAELTEKDMFALIGHAEYLRRVNGEQDMPAYLLELAGKIARARGDEAGALRCAAIALNAAVSAPTVAQAVVPTQEQK